MTEDVYPKRSWRHPPRGHQLDVLARQFQLSGFTIIRELFSASEVEQIRARLMNYMATRVAALPREAVIRADHEDGEIVILAKLDHHDDFFDRLKFDTRLQTIAGQLLPAETRPAHVDFINKHRDAQATKPHQDAYIFKRWPSQSLTFWLALDRIDCDNGCLYYARGSHWGMYRAHDRSSTQNRLLEYTASDRASEVAIQTNPGDVAVHHSFTIHRSEPNRTDRPRWALAIPFLRSDATLLNNEQWLAFHAIHGAVSGPTSSL